MIRVEFQEPVPGNTADYQATAVLVVEPDGSYTFDGSGTEQLAEVPVPLFDETDELVGNVTLAQNPAYWARNAYLSFRTPYLVPVVTDDEAVAEENA